MSSGSLNRYNLVAPEALTTSMREISAPLVESAFSMIKGKFGDSVRSKSDTGQINEALCKVLAHNICVLIKAMHVLNIHPIFGSETQAEPKMALGSVHCLDR